MTVRLVVFGGGNMGAALLGGLVASGWAPAAELAVVEPVEARRWRAGQDELPGVAVGADPPATPTGAVLAVKPGDVAAAAAAAGAAGCRPGAVDRRRRARPRPSRRRSARDAAVVRAMPNTPPSSGRGASAIAPGRHAGDADLDWAAGILGAVGTVVRVPEHLLDAVTGLSGSGPAYLFLVAEALIDGGVAGRAAPRRQPRSSRPSSWWARPRCWPTRAQSPEQLRAAVTSPGGTTAAGLRALERAGVRAAFLDASSPPRSAAGSWAEQ